MKNGSSSDGSILVKVTGCEYKVSENKLRAGLSHWGTITSEIKEELFIDPHDSEGTNRTGVYMLKMIVDQEIPEILPIEGLRVKLQYQGVKKLCTACFGKHLRKNCDGSKITWADYIRTFKESNLDIPDEFYGENLERFEKTKKAQENRNLFVPPRNEEEWLAMLKRLRKTSGPNPVDYNLPITEEEWKSMMKKMKDCGIDEKKAMAMIKERKTKFIEACQTHFNSDQNDGH